MKLVSDYFGCMVFDDKAMKKRLSPDVYKALERTMTHGRSLDLSVANAVAAAMNGFGDYSSFYRQYKNQFGTSPILDRNSKHQK